MTAVDSLETADVDLAQSDGRLGLPTRVTERGFNRSNGNHHARCHWCGLKWTSSRSGGIDGMSGRHQGTDGSAPSCPALNAELRDIIRHALGLGGPGDVPYRRYYCHDETPALLRGVELGMLVRPRRPEWLPDPIFYVTEKGAQSVGSTLEGMR